MCSRRLGFEPNGYQEVFLAAETGNGSAAQGTKVDMAFVYPDQPESAEVLDSAAFLSKSEMLVRMGCEPFI